MSILRAALAAVTAARGPMGNVRPLLTERGSYWCDTTESNRVVYQTYKDFYGCTYLWMQHSIQAGECGVLRIPVFVLADRSELEDIQFIDDMWDAYIAWGQDPWRTYEAVYVTNDATFSPLRRPLPRRVFPACICWRG